MAPVFHSEWELCDKQGEWKPEDKQCSSKNASRHLKPLVCGVFVALLTSPLQMSIRPLL